MHFEDVLIRHIGQFGTFQKMMICIFCVEEFFMSFSILRPVFTAAVPEYWCDTSSIDVHVPNCTISQESDDYFGSRNDSSSEQGQCWTSSNQTLTLCGSADKVHGTGAKESSKLFCQQWKYSQEHYTSTIVTEWGLVCGRSWLVGTVSAVYMAGLATGNFIFGFLADRFGRRKVVLGAGLFSLLCGIGCATAPNITFFLVARFLLANFAAGKTNCVFVLVNEYVGPVFRPLAGNIYFMAWCLGYVSLAGVAYFIRNWRILIVVTTVPEVVFYILYFFYVPESPRWLLSRNRHDEALDVAKKMSKMNKTALPQHLTLNQPNDDIADIKQNGNAVFTVFDLFRTPQIRLMTINLLFNWFSEGFVYYGLSLNSSNLGGNPFLNFAIAGALEIPAYILTPIICNYLGRIIPFSSCLILGGLALLATIPIPTDMVWLLITLSMVGKFFITITFSLIWTYCCEVYPTEIRNQGLTVTGIGSRFASIFASYVGMLSGVSKVLPLIIFGSFAITAGLLVLLLPETKNQALQQTIADGEVFIRNNKIFSRRRRNNRKNHRNQKNGLPEMTNLNSDNC